eukprot:m51a1_g8350 putative cytoplasmic trna 2-thiolation protein 1-like (333) ;mRNA; f:46983-48380
MSGPPLCSACGAQRAAARRAATSAPLCRACFCRAIEDDVHDLVVSQSLVQPSARIAVGVSGGKDSAVMARILTKINATRASEDKAELVLVSIDEGIGGYRDGSLLTVEESREEYGLDLRVVSFSDMYGHTMDEIAERTGRKSTCSFCGVFRRQALDKVASDAGCTLLATGHNADDTAETVLMNLLRGDNQRLDRCKGARTDGGTGYVPRCKPLLRLTQREVVLYARFEGIRYFSTECPYALSSYRGLARGFIKELEALRPAGVLDLVHSGDELRAPAEQQQQQQQQQQRGGGSAQQEAPLRPCPRCGYVTSQAICHACALVDAINSQDPLAW